MRKRDLALFAGVLSVPASLIGYGFSRSDYYSGFVIDRAVQSGDLTGLSLDRIVDNVIEIESHGDSDAVRVEDKIGDKSVGLGQILTGTAKQLSVRFPDLPSLGNDVVASLKDPKINKAYTERLVEELMREYEDPTLAVAAYNAGFQTPKVSLVQFVLNDLYDSKLDQDGINGKLTRGYVRRFQEDNGLYVDGKIGPETVSRITHVWEEKHPGKKLPNGMIPKNGTTPHHVLKFIRAVKNDP